MRPLTIVQWNSASCWGGGEIRTAEMSDNLRGRGHTVRVVCLADTPTHRWFAGHGFLCEPRAPRGSGDLLRAYQLGRVVRRWNADIVHAHAGSDYVPAVVAGRVAGCPVVLHRHLFRPLSGITRAVALRWRTMFVGDSEAVARSLVERDRIPQERVRCIRLLVDPARLKTGPDVVERARAEFQAFGRPVVVSVGHLYPSKGHDVLIRAFALVRGRLPDALLLIAGEGAERARLQSLITSLHLTDAVRLLGMRHDIPALLNLADCFALLSWEDPFPGAILEALACALPVVGCAAGGVPEMIRDGVTGFLVPPHDHRTAAERLLQLLTDRPLRGHMSAAAREDFNARFSIERMIDAVESVYAALVGAGREVIVP
jgi:glycosyltransferase involved in cell wall biosynthesis